MQIESLNGVLEGKKKKNGRFVYWKKIKIFSFREQQVEWESPLTHTKRIRTDTKIDIITNTMIKKTKPG